MQEQVVCKTSELQPGEIREAYFGKQNIVICRTQNDNFYAFMNQCIHQGAPLGKGLLCGATTDESNPGDYHYCHQDEILRCPWHGREFDMKNEGRMLANPNKKLASFKVRVENEDVIVYK